MTNQGDGKNQEPHDVQGTSSRDLPRAYVGNLMWMKFQSTPINTLKIPSWGDNRMSHLIRLGKRINKNKFELRQKRLFLKN